ncbi:MAG: DUF3311 domain-containing protein [Phycisphaerales bacterium]|nr:DUF3311 domain-containing protein [Phycisphaerales bacterium]MCB9863810.1 DUF3311 domain-containing protein [Phycisphaerales bacterium]
MKKLVYGLIILLAILHQDFWLWDSQYLVFDIVPIGLAYHAGISLAAALLWIAAIKYCWPDDVELLEEEIMHESDAAGGAR